MEAYNVDNPQELACLELCAGYAGISIGVRRVVPALRVVAVSEIEAYASANLVQKMEARLLDPAPNWTNLKTFPYRFFRGKIWLLIAGFPCQPFSHAGKGLSTEDPRHLYPYIAGGISIIRPSVIFLENVEGIISAKCADGTPVLLYVLRDLESRGYRPTWGIFSASEIRSSHQRKRVFIYAELADGNGPRQHKCQGDVRQERGWTVNGGEAVADGTSNRRSERRPEPEGQQGRFDASECGGTMGHTQNGPVSGKQWGAMGAGAEAHAKREADNNQPDRPSEELGNPSRDDQRGNSLPRQDGQRLTVGGSGSGDEMANPSNQGLQGCELRTSLHGNRNGQEAHGPACQFRDPRLPQHPPGPADIEGWRRVLEIDPSLAPAVEHQVRELANGRPFRVDELRLAGNAVHPDTAELAFRTLRARLRE